MIRRPPRSTLSSSSAASDVYKRQTQHPQTAQHRRTTQCLRMTAPSTVKRVQKRRKQRKRDPVQELEAPMSVEKEIIASVWQGVGHEWIGCRVSRLCNGVWSEGSVRSWRPEEQGEPAMWRVEFMKGHVECLSREQMDQSVIEEEEPFQL
eukprot:TRINITY_DN20115_c0_g1_i2.p1 TRINITY_DN20115_c0_g1~~TRINITY_DN20115_c0_g1_i2.p1  ORF type:complete len:150 (+),score=20.28 TRINITY_DN20115_c0_g1_i2:88-537(+)